MADTYNTGYPLIEGLASPPRMVAPAILAGRVRVAYGYIACSAVQEASGSIINITKLPLGATILGVLLKWGDMGTSNTITLKKGTTAISAVKTTSTAQAAYAIDYAGSGLSIDTEAERLINGVVGTGALDGTAGLKYECIILYVLD